MEVAAEVPSWDKSKSVAIVPLPLGPVEVAMAELKNAVFCPDGRRVQTASQDNTVRIWSVGKNGDFFASRRERRVESVSLSEIPRISRCRRN